MYRLKSYLSTFVCFSIMVVRIRFKMYNQLIRMSNNVRRGQGFGAGTQSYIQDTYKIHTRYMICLLKVLDTRDMHHLTGNSTGCSFTDRNCGVVIPNSWMANG